MQRSFDVFLSYRRSGGCFGAIKSGKNYNPIFLRGFTTTKELLLEGIFQKVQKRLDIYQLFFQSTDPNTAIYIPVVKNYYQLVTDCELDSVGTQIISAVDNHPNPFLKIGDIVITKKK